MIRPATLADLPALLALGERMHAESRYARLRFSAARLEQTLRAVLEAPLGFLRVVEIDGVVAGGMAAMACPHWASEDLVSTDLALFIAPDHRGGRTAALLVKRYRDWARAMGVVLPDIGVTTGVQTENTARLFEALGARRIGYVLEF